MLFLGACVPSWLLTFFHFSSDWIHGIRVALLPEETLLATAISSTHGIISKSFICFENASKHCT